MMDRIMKRHSNTGIFIAWLVIILSVGLSGCAGHPFRMKDSYKDYYQSKSGEESMKEEGMAEELAVLPASEGTSVNYHPSVLAALLVNDSTNEVVESYHCFDKVYPASVTKIMTALLVMEKGDMDDEITLTHNIRLSDPEAVACTLSAGDTATVDQVFHTMLIKSANDCSVILGEYISGSEEDFVDLMNQRAKELGATHTHFANTNGLHDRDHYTTAYDLYLIFNEAVKHEEFVDVISTANYTMTYTNASGRKVSEYMQSTNHYLTSDFPVPPGVTMYGGKTGTTSVAGSCLILMTENEKGERFFSVVLGSETKDNLYQTMSDLLEKIN